MIKAKYSKEAEKIRKALHKIPEASMKEKKTIEYLSEYLKKSTDLTVHNKGSWFYAVCNPDIDEPAVAFRADFDAVSEKDGKCRHICGHDGHAAVLAAFGKYLSENKPDKKIILIFQPGEETGEGAKLCSSIFETENISCIYGFHNLPGFSEGAVVIRYGIFACASSGLEIKLTGKPAHAAYPEEGNNPADAVSEIISKIKDYTAKGSRGILMATVIGIDCGSSSYGVSASDAVIRLTVRGEYQDEFESLTGFIHRVVSECSAEYGLESSISEHDVFSATENYDEYNDIISDAAESAGLTTVSAEVPFRWSENFGAYLKEKEGAFFGIGAGENCPGLHTSEYEFPDSVIPYALKILDNLC